MRWFDAGRNVHAYGWRKSTAAPESVVSNERLNWYKKRLRKVSGLRICTLEFPKRPEESLSVCSGSSIFHTHTPPKNASEERDWGGSGLELVRSCFCCSADARCPRLALLGRGGGVDSSKVERTRGIDPNRSP